MVQRGVAPHGTVVCYGWLRSSVAAEVSLGEKKMRGRKENLSLIPSIFLSPWETSANREVDVQRVNFNLKLMKNRQLVPVYCIKWLLRMVTSGEQISPSFLICKENTTQLHSLCMDVLFKITASGILLRKLRNSQFQYAAWWWDLLIWRKHA